MSEASNQRSVEFLNISSQFKLGALTTESSHPLTARLSNVAKQDISKALGLLFQVDGDVVAKYREFAESGRLGRIKETVLRALKNGGRLFFTGCGATGRLSIQLVSIWRDFWQQQRARGLRCSPPPEEWEDRAFSVMAGGDFALIKSVEGFEDFATFGHKQLADLGVSEMDVVFAITEGGETSFVIGTAWQGVGAGAKVFFVYNNPDDVLCRHVERSREVIEDPRIEKINLATGPMAITGSTRMQATTIQLCVLLTVLEMVVRDLMNALEPGGRRALDSAEVPERFFRQLVNLLLGLRGPDFRADLASLVELEESVYRNGGRNNYYADRFALDVLNDTTERAPTYCTPPFRKSGDTAAADSWSFLFTPAEQTPAAWMRLLKRQPSCLEWSEEEARLLVGEDGVARTMATLRNISRAELMRFRIGQDGADERPLGQGDSAIAILAGSESPLLFDPAAFFHRQMTAARSEGAMIGAIWCGGPLAAGQEFAARNPACRSAYVRIPSNRSLLKGIRRVGLKLVLNALSTCTMVRLGRVMGNTMIWVVPSNLKLIDRATRYIQKLARVTYEKANGLLFEALEYVEPRMKADQAYPPVVGLAVMRVRHKLTNEEAEARLVLDLRASATSKTSSNTSSQACSSSTARGVAPG